MRSLEAQTSKTAHYCEILETATYYIWHLVSFKSRLPHQYETSQTRCLRAFLLPKTALWTLSWTLFRKKLSAGAPHRWDSRLFSLCTILRPSLQEHRPQYCWLSACSPQSNGSTLHKRHKCNGVLHKRQNSEKLSQIFFEKTSFSVKKLSRSL